MPTDEEFDLEFARLRDQQDWSAWWAMVPEWTRRKRAWLMTIGDAELKDVMATGTLLGDYARAEWERREARR
jgi:hypothetical protein